MALATIIPRVQATVPSLNDTFNNGTDSGFNANGDTDYGNCVRVADDGEFLSGIDTGGGSGFTFINFVFFDDSVSIPISAPINSVKAVIRVSGAIAQGLVLSGGTRYELSINHPATFEQGFVAITGWGDNSPANDELNVGILTTFESPVMTTNPITGGAWTRADLFCANALTEPDPNNLDMGTWSFFATFGPLGNLVLDYFALVVDYTPAGVWWYSPSLDQYVFAASQPGPDFVEVPEPTVTVMAVYPNQGLSTGAAPVAVEGSGFSNGAGVTFDGVAATSVVVLNQHQLTCVTPAFAGVLGATADFIIGGEDPPHAGMTVKAKSAAVDVTVTNA